MDTRDTSGPAFPVYDHHGNGQPFLAATGMTLRDYFAAKAMHAFIVEPVEGVQEAAAWNLSDNTCTAFAKAAYQMADAMLKERA